MCNLFFFPDFYERYFLARWHLFLLAFYLTICRESSQSANPCLGDAELMMQGAQTCAKSATYWTLNGQIVTYIHPATVSLLLKKHSRFIPQPWYNMAYLAMQASHFIELIPSFAFVLHCAHMVFYSQWSVYCGMPRHCHSAGDQVRT